MILDNQVVVTWLVFVWVIGIVTAIFGGRIIIHLWTRDALTMKTLRTSETLANTTSNGLGSIVLILAIPLIGVEGGVTLVDLAVGWIILTVVTYSGTWYISRDYHSRLATKSEKD